MTVAKASEYVTRFERWPWETFPGLLLRFTAALVTTFLLCAPYAANICRDYSRYCYFWRMSDSLTLGLLLISVALMVTVAGELVRGLHKPILTRVFNHCFLAAFGVGVLTIVNYAAPKVPYLRWQLSTQQLCTAWLLLALCVGYSFGHPRCRWVLRCRQACQILLPVVPATFVSFFWCSYYPATIEPIVPIPHPCSVHTLQADHASRGAVPQGGIYVLLFDEWSYERTFAERSVMPAYPHLAEFAQTATVYHNAFSPYDNTEQSLPAMLMQTGDRPEVHHGSLGFRTADGDFKRARDCTSLFGRLKPHGYHTAIIGPVLPHRMWLGDSVDLCRTYCLYPRGHDLWSQLGIHLFNALHYSPDLWSRRDYKRWEQRILHAATCHGIGNTLHDVRTLIREWPSNTFAFMHLSLPHLPVVLMPDLTFCEPGETGWREGDLALYEANLSAMDAVLGNLIAELRRAGKYDHATIVLTSDHSWRKDPWWSTGRLTGPCTHVPLLIKAPRQDRRICIDPKFETKNLGELIESIVHRPHMDGVLMTENHPR